MKRFINIGSQITDDDSEPKEFAFFCTVDGVFEILNGTSIWDNVQDFADDYAKERGNSGVGRYFKIMPVEFRQSEIKNKKRVVVKGWFHSTQEFPKIAKTLTETFLSWDVRVCIRQQDAILQVVLR